MKRSYLSVLRICLTVLCVLGTLLWDRSAQAGEDAYPKWLTRITYAMALPLQETKDITPNFSPLGFSLDVRYSMTRSVALGITSGWQLFDSSTDTALTREGGDVAVQGRQNRYINTIPVLAVAQYTLSAAMPDWLRPFAGFGLGTYYIERRLDIGLFTLDDNAWHFGIAPEGGFLLHLGRFNPVVVVRYNLPFSADNSGNLPYLNINLGLTWT